MSETEHSSTMAVEGALIHHHGKHYGVDEVSVIPVSPHTAARAAGCVKEGSLWRVVDVDA